MQRAGAKIVVGQGRVSAALAGKQPTKGQLSRYKVVDKPTGPRPLRPTRKLNNHKVTR